MTSLEDNVRKTRLATFNLKSCTQARAVDGVLSESICAKSNRMKTGSYNWPLDGSRPSSSSACFRQSGNSRHVFRTRLGSRLCIASRALSEETLADVDHLLNREAVDVFRVASKSWKIEMILQSAEPNVPP